MYGGVPVHIPWVPGVDLKGKSLLRAPASDRGGWRPRPPYRGPAAATTSQQAPAPRNCSQRRAATPAPPALSPSNVLPSGGGYDHRANAGAVCVLLAGAGRAYLTAKMRKAPKIVPLPTLRSSTQYKWPREAPPQMQASIRPRDCAEAPRLRV